MAAVLISAEATKEGGPKQMERKVRLDLQDAHQAIARAETILRNVQKKSDDTAEDITKKIK